MMNVLALCAPNKLELKQIPIPELKPHEILLRTGAVGLCGTDFHIFQGHSNYNTDSNRRLIPLEEMPQILGHEFCGTIVALGSAVSDLNIYDRVVIDQGLNCKSNLKSFLCEYCVTGNSHQCEDYTEHGITGLQGALADYIAVPSVNAIKIENETPLEHAAMTEPLACIIHSSSVMMNTPARYTFNGDNKIQSILICGAGPAGLLFTQYIRNVICYDGLLIVSEPNELRRKIAAEYGATVIDPEEVNIKDAVKELTQGRMIDYMIDAAGTAQLFKMMPELLRKQATVMLYAHGQHGADLGVLNNLQFMEPTLIATVGASGGFLTDGRPEVYRRSLDSITKGKIDVSRIVTHKYHSLETVPDAFSKDRFNHDYIKGIAVLK